MTGFVFEHISRLSLGRGGGALSVVSGDPPRIACLALNASTGSLRKARQDTVVHSLCVILSSSTAARTSAARQGSHSPTFSWRRTCSEWQPVVRTVVAVSPAEARSCHGRSRKSLADLRTGCGQWRMACQTRLCNCDQNVQARCKLKTRTLVVDPS